METHQTSDLRIAGSTPAMLAFFYFIFPVFLLYYDPLVPCFFYIVWAYGAMETHQTSDLRIAGSTPAMLVFLLFYCSFFFALFSISSSFLCTGT